MSNPTTEAAATAAPADSVSDLIDVVKKFLVGLDSDVYDWLIGTVGKARSGQTGNTGDEPPAADYPETWGGK